jgi:hypothetical protein
MLSIWPRYKSVRRTPQSITSRPANMRSLKRPGVPPAKQSPPPLEVPRSSGFSPVRRGLLLVLFLGACSVSFLPSRTFAQSSTAGSTTTAEAEPAGSYVVGGLILAGVLIIGYVTLRVLRRREWPDVGHIVAIVAPTTAITAGVRLGVVAISAKKLGPFVSEDRVFIPLAGLALVLVSAEGIYKVMRDGGAKRASRPAGEERPPDRQSSLGSNAKSAPE